MKSKALFQRHRLKCTHLAKLLINYPELEVVADDVFIKRDDEPGSLRMTGWFMDMCCWWIALSQRGKVIFEEAECLLLGRGLDKTCPHLPLHKQAVSEKGHFVTF